MKNSLICLFLIPFPNFQLLQIIQTSTSKDLVRNIQKVKKIKKYKKCMMAGLDLRFSLEYNYRNFTHLGPNPTHLI